MFPRVERKIGWSQKGHGAVGNFLIAHVPPDDGSVEEGFLSSFFGIVFPKMAEVGHHQALVVVNVRSSSGGRACGMSVDIAVRGSFRMRASTTHLVKPPNIAKFSPLKNAVATRPSSQDRSNFRKFASVNKSRGLESNTAFPFLSLRCMKEPGKTRPPERQTPRRRKMIRFVFRKKSTINQGT